MCKSDIGNYLKRVETTYKVRSLEHTNTRVSYVSSEHSSEVNESHNPTNISGERKIGAIDYCRGFGKKNQGTKRLSQYNEIKRSGQNAVAQNSVGQGTALTPFRCLPS
jgi:hypothetical protein